MPFFTENEIVEPDFIESAWIHLKYGSQNSRDGLMLPESLPLERRIILLERLRQYALSQAPDLTGLTSFTDFQELVNERRPDPTQDQWLWLYTQIGERHRILPLDQVIGIMAGRDALLPFLEMVPDKKVWEWFASVKDEISVEPLPYPGIEDAIQADASAKLMIYKIMCKGVTDEQILARAIYLGKPEIAAVSMKKMSSDQRIWTLIRVHTDSEDPLLFFQKLLPQFEQEIAEWRDPWGNGFFWYLYRRPVLIRELIESLPGSILATFNTQNIYGISPADLWKYYCPHPKW